MYAPARVLTCRSVFSIPRRADPCTTAEKFNLSEPTISGLLTRVQRRVTIRCVGGKLTSRITAVKPRCPVGYRKKKDCGTTRQVDGPWQVRGDDTQPEEPHDAQRLPDDRGIQSDSDPSTWRSLKFAHSNGSLRHCEVRNVITVGIIIDTHRPS